MSAIIHPVISEKANALSETGVYAFKVERDSNTLQIKKEIEKRYSVRVVKVNIIAVHSKKRMMRGKLGIKPGYKKALVFLKKGQKIDIA